MASTVSDTRVRTKMDKVATYCAVSDGNEDIVLPNGWDLKYLKITPLPYRDRVLC